ncbi:hypothetical protein OROHE_001309 [Orobanche hederae]
MNRVALHRISLRYSCLCYYRNFPSRRRHNLSFLIPPNNRSYLPPTVLLSQPWVEYKGVIPQSEMQNKQKELELEANALISVGAKVSADILFYDDAANLCGGILPDYVPKVNSLSNQRPGDNITVLGYRGRTNQESSPRIVQVGDSPGCPCGGTHVLDISDITKIKVSQIRSKKGMTKVFYNIET